MSIRESVLWEVELLSQPSLQLEFDSLTVAGHPRSELVSAFCADYHPKPPSIHRRI